MASLGIPLEGPDSRVLCKLIQVLGPNWGRLDRFTEDVGLLVIVGDIEPQDWSELRCHSQTRAGMEPEWTFLVVERSFKRHT